MNNHNGQLASSGALEQIDTSQLLAKMALKTNSIRLVQSIPENPYDGKLMNRSRQDSCALIRSVGRTKSDSNASSSRSLS
jgi:hypothetical protein